ncbi:hypothetical protein GCM10009853_022820 [Glycomyces scopariae]|uniref:Uncharacterized protein n=1 Tax=Glycomyces sambucus TaxID=380244 RepID=A0A1G9J789_9ACTN|nr:hypothetical protein [Glycomyces sambucus]SDL33398.1 hypothetical protein SAMN05216298_3470 [Glycomyces sambucus]
MAKQKDLSDEIAEPGAESDAIRMSDITGGEGADIGELHGKELLDEDVWAPEPRRGVRPVVLAVAAVGVAAAAVVALKIAYDRKHRSHGYRKALEQLEDARDALLSAASDLPERGREALHRVTRR